MVVSTKQVKTKKASPDEESDKFYPWGPAVIKKLGTRQGDTAFIWLQTYISYLIRNLELNSYCRSCNVDLISYQLDNVLVLFFYLFFYLFILGSLGLKSLLKEMTLLANDGPTLQFYN